jgi:hypothetical protein
LAFDRVPAEENDEEDDGDEDGGSVDDDEEGGSPDEEDKGRLLDEADEEGGGEAITNGEGVDCEPDSRNSIGPWLFDRISIEKDDEEDVAGDTSPRSSLLVSPAPGPGPSTEFESGGSARIGSFCEPPITKNCTLPGSVEDEISLEEGADSVLRELFETSCRFDIRGS